MNNFPHLIKGLDPVADAFSGTVYSDIVSLKNHNKAHFIIYKGVGATGTSVITIEASSDNAGTAVSAIPFKYQAITTGDIAGALTDAAKTGFTTTAGSSQIYVIFVDSEDLAASGYEWVRLKAVEDTDSPVLGGILINLVEPKYNQPVQPSAI